MPAPLRIRHLGNTDLDGRVLFAMRGADRDLLLANAPEAAGWTNALQWRRPIGDEPIVPLCLRTGTDAELRVGRAIAPALLTTLSDTEDRLGYVRWRTELLACSEDTPEPMRGAGAVEPVAQAEPSEWIAREIADLGPDHRLLDAGEYSVYLAEAPAIPRILCEIGRLREIAFRAAGEGTGRRRDLDRFDDGYHHLFVWNAERREIAGAYRLRLTDDNPAALYTTTLFQLAPEFFGSLGPAIELGRSFIRVEYQKSFAPLLLLWKGIGRVVAAHPEHSTLFGPVSISNSYQSISRELMMAFLEQHAMLADLARWVRPKCAPKRRAGLNAGFCRDVETLSDVVADLEPERRGVPVLLRQYLRLGGKLLGFNVDHDFAAALDGLIVVDLTKTDPRLVERFFGKAEAAALRSHSPGCSLEHSKGNRENHEANHS
ncbi:MAG: GNAT family N-acyltransferase [Bryobacteraceae bacterium]